MAFFRKCWAVAAISLFAFIQYTHAQTWTQTSAPTSYWDSIACSADGNTVYATSASSGVFISTNSGSTWFQAGVPQAYGTSIASSADGTKLAAVASSVIFSDGQLYISTNSGVTWSLNNAATIYLVVSSADGNTLAMAGGNPRTNIYISTNAGNTWTTINTSLGLESIAISADGSILAAWGKMETQTVLLVSTNSGSYWTTNDLLDFTYSPPGLLNHLPPIPNIAMSADGKKFVTAYGNGIYSSTDLGATWAQIGVPGTNLIMRVALSADGYRLVAISEGGGGAYPGYIGSIFTSTISGTTWINQNVPVPALGFVASSADGSKLYAALDGGGIWTSQSTPASNLNITATNNIQLSWIWPSTNFVLQQCCDLCSWTDITNAPALNLSTLQYEVALPMTNTCGFYRLATP